MSQMEKSSRRAQIEKEKRRLQEYRQTDRQTPRSAPTTIKRESKLLLRRSRLLPYRSRSRSRSHPYSPHQA